jgi:hypothetical protein
MWQAREFNDNYSCTCTQLLLRSKVLQHVFLKICTDPYSLSMFWCKLNILEGFKFSVTNFEPWLWSDMFLIIHILYNVLSLSNAIFYMLVTKYSFKM